MIQKLSLLLVSSTILLIILLSKFHSSTIVFTMRDKNFFYQHHDFVVGIGWSNRTITNFRISEMLRKNLVQFSIDLKIPVIDLAQNTTLRVNKSSLHILIRNLLDIWWWNLLDIWWWNLLDIWWCNLLDIWWWNFLDIWWWKLSFYW